MRQVSKPRNTIKNSGGNKKRKDKDRRLPPKQKVNKSRKHPNFGTSQAEQNFARDFLDKLDVDYVWQYEAKEIGRFFDYYLPRYRILIEYQGSFWHGDSRIYEKKDLTPTQKHSQRVDEEKKKWALLHGIPLIEVWEKDVNEHPDQVMEMLRERLKIQGDVMDKKIEMNKRHVNKLNEDKN